MMLPRPFDLVIFVVLFSIGALAKPFVDREWTYYNVQTGNEVYCGGRRSNGEAIVALSGHNMNLGRCWQKIKMTYNGTTKFATIVDMCPGCKEWGLDLSESLFRSFALLRDGVIRKDNAWEFV